MRFPCDSPGAASRGARTIRGFVLALVALGIPACGPDPDAQAPRPVPRPVAGPGDPVTPAFARCTPPAEPRVVARADLQAFLDRGIHDLLGRIRTSAVFDRSGPGARFIGYRLVGLESGIRCGLLGLVEGDVVVSVNGLGVETPDGFMAIWAALYEAIRIEVELVQGGEAVLVVIDVVDSAVRLDNDGVAPIADQKGSGGRGVLRIGSGIRGPGGAVPSFDDLHREFAVEIH